MDKKQLQAQVIAELEKAQEQAHKAALEAHEAATHEENIAENKYDTRGLEASYLASGQARRYEEIRQTLLLWRQLVPRPFSEEQGIQLGNVVELTNTQGQQRWLFLGPNGASMTLQHKGVAIQVISPQAPLGLKLLGKVPGDEVSLELGNNVQLFEVLSVY